MLIHNFNNISICDRYYSGKTASKRPILVGFVLVLALADCKTVSSPLEAGAIRKEDSLESAQDTLPDDYLLFRMSPADDQWTGSCEHLPGFTISLDIPDSSIESGFDLKTLYSIIKSQNITGTVSYPSGKTTPIAYELVNHRGKDEIYMKSSLGYFLWERLRIAHNRIEFAIYWWYHPPAQEVDLQILELTELLLENPAHWHKNDDRVCEDDERDNRWSLFCALRYASIKKTGEYNHHNTAIQTVRFVIDDRVRNHGYAHTLMDHNNAPTTEHSDILSCIENAKQRIRTLLNRDRRHPNP